MTYDDVRQAINAQLPAASLNGADRIAAAILALMMRSGMQNVDATTLMNAFVKPGSDPTQGGAV
ncbi:hypothetical protein [Bradyrhizobium sp.]|uniref:hypothetical protein n=1 Tax=Bradyrhizobium sp. TaxID=376 RepID=UPI003C3326CB